MGKISCRYGRMLVKLLIVLPLRRHYYVAEHRTDLLLSTPTHCELENRAHAVSRRHAS
jgi:hypothetical protein